MEPLISVIVPVYNVEDYLGRCINSIINQTYSHLEIILVDDGSTDASGEICDSYAGKDARIRVIHKSNGGVSSARNDGLKVCEGDYITFVDSDDWIAAEYCETLLQLAQMYNAEIASCALLGTDGHAVFSMDQLSLDNREVKRVDLDDPAFEFFQWYSINAPYCKLIKKQLIFEGQSISFDEDLCVGEDLVFYIELLQKSKTCMAVAQPLYFYFQRVGSAMQTRDFRHQYSEVLAWNKVCEKLDSNGIPFRAASEKLLFYTYRMMKQFVKGGEKIDQHAMSVAQKIIREKREYSYILGAGWKFRLCYKILLVTPKLYFRILAR